MTTLETNGATSPALSGAESLARLGLYLSEQASWYISLGIQFVLLPYLVAKELHGRSIRVGITQMSLMTPSVLLFLSPIWARRADGV